MSTTATNSKKRKVLYVVHGHPAVLPGGAETYAMELFESMRASSEFEPIFLARVPPDNAHPGTQFSVARQRENEYFWHAGIEEFDLFFMTVRNKEHYIRAFRSFLQAHRPDIIHFQHTHFLGYDLLREARNTLPDTPLIYTLHEYLPICHRSGQMLRMPRMNRQDLCTHSSPQRCHECFPAITPQSFFLRKRFIESHFALVDMFLSPSKFLVERYVDWGIPRERIRFEENGRPAVQPVAEQRNDARKRNRFAFFGQINPYKGVDVLLKAMRLLAKENVHLWLHGANLHLQESDFVKQVKALLDETRDNVTLAGSYDPADLPVLMANIDWVVVPSIWYENAPLVIQEAFQHGRPVICSDIGGMAEKVTDGVSGLHFRRGDPESLAATIRRAVHSKGLWGRLHAGVPKVYSAEQHVASLTRLYDELQARRAAPTASVPVSRDIPLAGNQDVQQTPDPTLAAL
jgi:glycosyltransferase involved in cell wall biosynthesis